MKMIIKALKPTPLKELIIHEFKHNKRSAAKSMTVAFAEIRQLASDQEKFFQVSKRANKKRTDQKAPSKAKKVRSRALKHHRIRQRPRKHLL